MLVKLLNKTTGKKTSVRAFAQLVNWETSQPLKDQSAVSERKYISPVIDLTPVFI